MTNYRRIVTVANRVCKDLVAHDHPGSNPFRDLIPLAAHHAFLLHILVATSAVHFSNITRPRMNTLPSLEPLGQVGRLEGVSEDVELSKTALIESLAAKQQAIRHLRIALDDAATIGNDVLLAGILFFVNFELIYVGKSVWRTHLNGAREIMMSLCATWSTEPPSRRRLRDCVVADCLMYVYRLVPPQHQEESIADVNSGRLVSYHILGSTLSSTDELASSISNLAIDLLPVLERTEASCYLCCPAAILRIILASSQLANAVSAAPLSDETISYALGLMKQALSFDIHAWATSIGHLSTIADAESREHVASAHRSAAALYIPQAIPTLRPLGPVSTDELVVDILEHLSRIGENDAHFKATTWPTFIVGAETRDPDKRAWVLRRLLAVWESCPWGYIVTAIETLRTTWKLQDERPADVRVSWLEELRELNFDCLVI